jgi:hypothetical protein
MEKEVFVDGPVETELKKECLAPQSSEDAPAEKIRKADKGDKRKADKEERQVPAGLPPEVFFDDFVNFVGDAFDLDDVGDAFDAVAPPGGYISGTEAFALVKRLVAS